MSAKSRRVSPKSPVKFAKRERSKDKKERSPKRKRKTKPHSFATSSIRSSRLSRILSDESHQIRKSLKHYIVEDLENYNRDLHFQRVYVLAKNQEISDSMKLGTSQLTPEQKYVQYFRHKLDIITDICDLTKISNDAVSGLLICMGTYSLFMIEGPEQVLGDYFQQLALIENKLWKKSKIFLVENYIGWPHFDNFVFCISDAVNTNKKFPPNTITEANLMAAHHVYLTEKISSVVEQLVHDIKLKTDYDMDVNEVLSPDPYNKLLPTIQRIDLCLDADKFYLNLDYFAQMYFTLIYYKDHDTFFWPVEYNYTPLNIFNRSPYDVNLTFSDYDKIAGIVEDVKDERPSLNVAEIIETVEARETVTAN